MGPCYLLGHKKERIWGYAERLCCRWVLAQGNPLWAGAIIYMSLSGQGRTWQSIFPHHLTLQWYMAYLNWSRKRWWRLPFTFTLDSPWKYVSSLWIWLTQEVGLNTVDDFPEMSGCPSRRALLMGWFIWRSGTPLQEFPIPWFCFVVRFFECLLFAVMSVPELTCLSHGATSVSCVGD